MTDYIRRRNNAEHKRESHENDFGYDVKDGHGETARYEGLKLGHCLLVLVFHVLIFALAVYTHHYVPGTKVNANKGDFAEWRARKHLDEITSYGFRPAGSFANEHKAVEYLLNTLRSFDQAKRHDIVLDIDLQRPSGSFSIDFLEDFTSYYRNVSNVVARVSSKKNYPAKHSVLINAHFDSSFGGPGASDDAVSCATMLEIIRCLTESNAHIQLNHSLVFLFNGAEENFLQASHGFITQHHWAKDIRVFVNLEAAGAGGREVVFQTGPEHPWLIKLYANSADYPFASIVGQELFQTGLIPGETDFRIFRDYGNIPGIDIAYVTNGYVYHTTRDLPQAITPGSIQRAGENLLGMLVRLSQSPLVADPSGDQHGAMVFYDFLGLYMVLYPQRIGWILNSVVAAVTFVCIALKFSKKSVNGVSANGKAATRINSNGNLSVKPFAKALFYILLSWLSSLLSVFLIAKVITASGQSLSWYCKPYLLIGLYVLPGMLVMCGIHYWQATHFKKSSSWPERWSQEDHMFYATLFLWNSLLSLMNYYNLGSAYLFMLMVAFPLFGRVFIWEICLGKSPWTSDRSNCKNAFVSMYLLSIAIPLVLWSYMFWMHLDFFIAIFGRTGGNDPPEILISLFVTFFVLIFLSYALSLVHVVSHVKPLLLPFAGIWLFSATLVISGSIFPYSAEPWCPKRIIFQHMSRTFHDSSGQVSHRDAGLWVVPFDYLGIKYIDHLPEFKDAQVPNMDNGLFGDFPYYMPVGFMFDKTWYIPGPVAEVSTMATLKLLSKKRGKRRRTILKFELDGPSHMSLYLSPKLGVEVIDSSLGELSERSIPRTTQTSERPQYFVYYSHGIYTGPWHFWVELESSTTGIDDLIDIAMTGHYSHGKDSKSKFLSDFLNKLPEWVDSTAWVSAYQKWTF